MIPYILAAVGGYLLYDATKKQRSPLDNPYNILADGGQTSDERYFIYKDDESILKQIKDNVKKGMYNLDSDDVEKILDRTFVDIHKKENKAYLEKTYKEITKSEKDMIIKVALDYGVAKMVNGEIKIVEKEYDDEDYADGGEVGRFKILKDETGYVEQGFYGVFDTKNNELLDIFEFRKEAEGFVKELNKKGSKADASKYNGRINDYVLAKGGKVKWIQDALSGGKNKGALRRTAKKKGLLRGDENLSATDLKKLQKMGGTTAKRAHMAETLRKLK